LPTAATPNTASAKLSVFGIPSASSRIRSPLAIAIREEPGKTTGGGPPQGPQSVRRCRVDFGRPANRTARASNSSRSIARPPAHLRRHRKRQHLRYRPRINPITPSRFPPAQTLDLNRITNLSIELHALHPPAPAACRQRPSAAGFLLRRNRTARPLQ